MEYFKTNLGFTNLTINNLNGQNWKSLMTYNSLGQVFSGDTNAWVYSSYPIDHIALSNGGGILRFRALGQGNTNWIIDDFEIYVPPQNSAAPRDLIFVNGLPDTSNQVSLKVFNSGHKNISEFMVTIFDQSGSQLLVDTIQNIQIFQPATARTYNLKYILQINPATTELMVVTSRPNDRADALPTDDTLRVPIRLLQPVSQLPYCIDFEAAPSLLGFTNGIADNLWSHTTPQKMQISGAHSGNMSWLTARDTTYPPLADSYLYTSELPLAGGQCYTLSFWHWYDTEFNFDGGLVEYTLDTGQTWEVLGEYEDTAWYNTPAVQALDAINPGFSGQSGGWTEAYTEINATDTGMVRFRFRFASGATGHGDGWAIDDLCFEQVSSNCNPISLRELAPAKNSLSLYPNPAEDQLHVKLIPAHKSRAISFKLYDPTGKRIRQWQQAADSDGNYSLPISGLPQGIYTLQLKTAGHTWQQQFVKR
ncbi:MAG: T9SS type A sorting domain-containing protein [Owenweeksia sp.]|nr:T9SS type A sorting domain-containing protein [Owenweeksia sp.]